MIKLLKMLLCMAAFKMGIDLLAALWLKTSAFRGQVALDVQKLFGWVAGHDGVWELVLVFALIQVLVSMEKHLPLSWDDCQIREV